MPFGGAARSGPLSTVIRALVLSCHPIPSLAVTAISAGLAALAGLSLPRAALLVAAVFAGQLSIGWSNDAIDAARDRVSQRSDKPVASGAVSPRLVAVAAAVALVGAIVLSLALGLLPGLASLTVIACGWLYNLGLKATVVSFVPYAIAFGTLPAIATLALPQPQWPATWAVLAGALFGVSAHLANVLPDLDDDVHTGVRGLPHRLGQRATAVACPVLLAAAALVILFGTTGGSGPEPWRWVAAALLLLISAAGVVIALRRPTSRALFLIVIVVALSSILLFGFSGQSLS
ncbi:MAG: UbiA family prenyltransferase [Nakamurella sp.]